MAFISLKFIYLISLCLTSPVMVVIFQYLRHYSQQSPEHTALARKTGHLKPFGCCTGRIPVQSVEKWPHPRDFFRSYVKKKKPLLIKNGAKISPAYTLWTDEYFLNVLDVPKESSVNIETGKKEVRVKSTVRMNFKDWVRAYNHSDKYMVEDLPSYLGKDIIFPPSVQCDGFPDMVVTGVMWFSSGGTKSVVHTDSADNMNCLYRGRKSLVLVDPQKHGNKVPIDRPDGTYSTIDVDSVDYTKYPGLAETEFYYVDMEAGDCLYIPYLWIHQVNSYDSNIAVNVWWDHEKSLNLDLTKCLDKYDTTMTMDELNSRDWEQDNTETDEYLDDYEEDEVRQYESHVTKKGAMSFDDFVREMVEDEQWLAEVVGVRYMDLLRNMFTVMDRNDDGYVRGSEFDTFTEEENDLLDGYFEQLMAIRSIAEKTGKLETESRKDEL